MRSIPDKESRPVNVYTKAEFLYTKILKKNDLFLTNFF